MFKEAVSKNNLSIRVKGKSAHKRLPPMTFILIYKRSDMYRAFCYPFNLVYEHKDNEIARYKMEQILEEYLEVLHIKGYPSHLINRTITNINDCNELTSVLSFLLSKHIK